MDATDAAIAGERRLHLPAVRQDRDAVDELLAEDFMEFGSSGLIWTRAEMLDAIAHFPSSTMAMEVVGMDARELAPGIVLVTYLSAIGERKARRSSIWRVVDGVARIVFHQATLIS